MQFTYPPFAGHHHRRNGRGAGAKPRRGVRIAEEGCRAASHRFDSDEPGVQVGLGISVKLKLISADPTPCSPSRSCSASRTSMARSCSDRARSISLILRARRTSVALVPSMLVLEKLVRDAILASLSSRNPSHCLLGNINVSLLALGRVITALTSNAPHVPYRYEGTKKLVV